MPGVITIPGIFMDESLIASDHQHKNWIFLLSIDIAVRLKI